MKPNNMRKRTLNSDCSNDDDDDDDVVIFECEDDVEVMYSCECICLQSLYVDEILVCWGQGEVVDEVEKAMKRKIIFMSNGRRQTSLVIILTVNENSKILCQSGY